MMSKPASIFTVALLSLAAACVPGGDVPSTEEASGKVLGPVDGRELPGAELGRISVGEEAPDFSLLSYGGDTLTLSENRGQRETILVFFRGHW